MVVKFKKLNEKAVTPSKAYDNDAGFDLVAVGVRGSSKYIEYATGIAVEIPNGYVGLLFPRGSNSKMDLLLTNSVGVIDAGYRGEIFFRYKPTQWNGVWGTYDAAEQYYEGDKVGQLVILELPKIELEEVNELEVSIRGEGRFGSSGR